jgi:hypothetical protein
MATKDKDGRALDRASIYRLNVPADAPVRLYWSATVYDRATHALIRDQKAVSRSSLSPGLQMNADGSVDVYFGPRAPAGNEANWVPTSAGGKFEVLVRFNCPEKALFEKTWKLPDIERIAAFSLGILSWGGVCAAQEYEFRNGYPTPETARRVQDEQDYQRAVQAYRFFYPAVSMEGTFQGTRDAGAEDNKVRRSWRAAPGTSCSPGIPIRLTWARCST